MSKFCILLQPEPSTLHTFAPAAPCASQGIFPLFNLAAQTLLKRRGSTVISVGENYPLSPWEPRDLPPAGCVIPRPQFLPLSNGDLTTNLPGLLWRVTEIIHKSATPSFPIPDPDSLKGSAKHFQKRGAQAVPCACTQAPPPAAGGWFSLAAPPGPAALSPRACYQPP